MEATDEREALVALHDRLQPPQLLRVADHLFWQARAAVGGSSNNASPGQTYTDEFETNRRLISSALTTGQGARGKIARCGTAAPLLRPG